MPQRHTRERNPQPVPPTSLPPAHSVQVLTVSAGGKPPGDGDGDVQLPAFGQRQERELLNGPDTLLHLVP